MFLSLEREFGKCNSFFFPLTNLWAFFLQFFLYYALNAKLNCNNIRIPTLTTTSENAGNHFLFDLNDNLLSKLNLTLPVDHKLYNDLKIFHTLNSENKKILNNKECLNSHFYITLSNSLVTGILLTGLAIGILTYLYRERNKARVNN